MEFKIEYSKFVDRQRSKKNLAKKRAETDLADTAKKTTDKDEPEGFKFGGFNFQENDNGKLKCGVCKDFFTRLIFHMNGSTNCARNFNMTKFKLEYAKYKHRQKSKKLENDQGKQQNTSHESIKATVDKHARSVG